VPARDQQIALDWTHTFSGSLLNQARYSFSRAGFGFEGGAFPNCLRASINACPTGISLGGTNFGFGIANNLPQGRTIDNSQVQDNVSLVHGRHTFKFGGEFYKQRSPNTFLPNINGTYTFSGAGVGNRWILRHPIRRAPPGAEFDHLQLLALPCRHSASIVPYGWSPRNSTSRNTTLPLTLATIGG